MNREEQAVEYKHNGHNCCQAVLAVYADELGIAPEMAKKLGAGFGVGMGGMEATCGALCAAQMVLGMKSYTGKPILKDAKALHQSFQQLCGDTICKMLKGVETGKVLCDCDDCVRNAVRVLEE